MDLVFICRDALASSLLGNILLAQEAYKSGMKVAILFTEEALAALSMGIFMWPKDLQGQSTRLTMANNAPAMDVPVMLKGQGKQVDVMGMFQKAINAGVDMYACPIWSQLLGLKGKLPQGVAEMDLATMLKTLGEAKKVIGSF